MSKKPKLPKKYESYIEAIFNDKNKSLETGQKIVTVIKEVFIKESGNLRLNLKGNFTEFSKIYLTNEFITKIETELNSKLKTGGGEEKECPICTEEINDNNWYTFHCKHNICKICYTRLTTDNRNVVCPICRTQEKCGFCKEIILSTNTTKKKLTQSEKCNKISGHYKCGLCTFLRYCYFCNNYDEEDEEEDLLDEERSQSFLGSIQHFQRNVSMAIESRVDRLLPEPINLNRILMVFFLYLFLKIIFDRYNDPNSTITTDISLIALIVSRASELNSRITREIQQYSDNERRLEFIQQQQQPNRGGKRRKQNKKTERKKRKRRTVRTRKNKKKR